jgi:mono/diheme cytochrome c family protein
MSTHTVLLVVNTVAIVAVIGYLLYRVVIARRKPDTTTPENLEPFFADDVLEGAHLERALGVALIALVIVVVGMLAYFIWEPFRENAAATGFKEDSIQRGSILFANSQSKEYDATKSLLCANCHGVDGGGGVATFSVKSEDPRCDPKAPITQELADSQPYCLPKQVSWAAPSLQLASLRYTPEQLTNIITYGRPGTPMPSWGVASGKGVLQEQGIEDLVNYVESLATTSDKAKTAAAAEAQNCDSGGAPIRGACVGKAQLDDAAVQAAAAKWVVDAQADLDLVKAERAQQTTADNIATYDRVVAQKQETLQVAQAWQETTKSATDGQILFMNNCARCHTRGWSYFDPTNPEANPPMGIMAGGAYGPNLTNGDVNGQFPPPDGEAELFAWISEGVPANEAYGIRGISSGRMAHFGAVLTKTQIEAIMAYERSL